MDFLIDVWSKAKKANKRIVLPETNDVRVLKAAELIIQSRLAQVILVGNESISIEGASTVNPKTFPRLSEYAKSFAIKREKKGMNEEKATQILSTDNVFFAAMMVEMNDADGMVTGSNSPTSETIRATIQCIGTDKDSTIISSFFAMISPKIEFGEEGLIFFADCGVNPNPTSEELAQIAIQTADSFTKLAGFSPRIAMLSFSTKGSAAHPDVDKVTKALQIVKAKNPELQIDGEMQVDAALIPSIGKKKAPGSSVAGHANILIFPDLDSGNIGYKLTERFGGCTALGPLLQGCKKAVNDLSRGCSVEDIVNVTALTAVQAS